MDISNPTIIRVNNRNYRCLHSTNFNQRSKQPINKKRVIVDEYDDEEQFYTEDFVVTEPKSLDEQLVKEEEELIELEEDELSEDQRIDELIKRKEVQIEITDNGKYMGSIHVPISVRGFIIGKNGSNIKEICSKTKTEIDFPDQHRRDDPFLILAQNERSVLSACLKFNDLIKKKRLTSNLTHFLAIKCSNEETRSNYELFKEIVLSKHLPQGYPEKVFIGAGKLHLTISILALFDNFERNKMVSFMNKNLTKVINSFVKEKNDILKGEKKFKFIVKGLDYMNDDPSAIRILYAKVNDETQFIQSLCNRINDATNESGLACEIKSNVKLHMSLMNTRYLPSQFKKSRATFDATTIMKDDLLKDFYFGKVDLDSIHLLVSGTLDETGSYISTHKINVF